MRKIVATFFAAFSLAFLATLPALAQSTQATPSRQAAPSPAMKVAVRRMLDAMQFPQLTRNIFDQMLQSVPAMIRQSAQQQINGNPKLDEQRKARAGQRRRGNSPGHRHPDAGAGRSDPDR